MKPQLNIEPDCQFVDNTLNILSKYKEAKISFLRHHTQLALTFNNKVKQAAAAQTEAPGTSAD